MKIAVFPGSFDPYTLAHHDLVERALPMFDKIYVAIGVNSSKVGLMDVETKMDAIKELYASNPKIEVTTYKESYFLVSRSGLAHISSTIVRDIWRNNGDIKPLVPAQILKHIEKLDRK